MDPEDPLKGFMRGYLLVYRHIFTSPTSAISGNRNATKPSKAFLHSLTSVTGRTLAYAAVQACFAISSVEAWNSCDGPFDYEMFYFNMVAIFEDEPENPWVVETLKWWNQQLPDLVKPIKKRKRAALQDEDIGDVSDDNGVVDLRRAMKARMAQVSRVVAWGAAKLYPTRAVTTQNSTAASSASSPSPSIITISAGASSASSPTPSIISIAARAKFDPAHSEAASEERRRNHANRRQPSTSPAGPPRTKRLHRRQSHSQDAPREQSRAGHHDHRGAGSSRELRDATN
ncbi:hypothetical protein H0H92_004132, partial [Tricholoma furcatifolium]